MIKEEIKYWLLIFVTFFFASCNYYRDKGDVQKVTKKDSVKAIVKAEPEKKVMGTYLIIDTIAGKDTIKVVLYNSTMIKCSVNSFSDTINVVQNGINWDTSYSEYSKNEEAPILIPGIIKPQKFISNDSLLLIPVCDGNFRTQLYMINRKRNGIKFSGHDVVYTLFTSSHFIYIDLNHNVILNYADKIYIDTLVNGVEEEISRYPIFKYKIEHKQIVQTNSAISYFKQFDKLDMEKLNDIRAFYDIILQKENWKRDRYKLWK